MAKEKIHPEDRMLADLIASAESFTAHIRLAPHDKTTVRGLRTYREALNAAAALNATSRYGRRAMVYAVTPKGWTVPVDAKLAELAGIA
jgi:hypothetical protein